MERWTRPYVVEENLLADQNVAESNCYKIKCSVNDQGRNYDASYWNYAEKGLPATGAHSGPCSHSENNRVITNNGLATNVGEVNSAQGGWLDGFIDRTIDVNNDGIGPGDIVFWHTVSSDGHSEDGTGSWGLWNHWGVIENTDPNHPNHS